MPAGKSQSLWTPTFALLCCAQFFGSAQHALLQPTFPLYITSLGGTPFKVGLVIACFAVTRVVFRPLIGGWADKWSETGVLICGLGCLSIAVVFCFIRLAEATMFANALRGLGWAAMSAAGYSLLALSAPAERRGEASGYYSGVQASGTIFVAGGGALANLCPVWRLSHRFFVAIALAAIGARRRCAAGAPYVPTRSQPTCRFRCSVVAGNFERHGPRNHSGLGAFVYLSREFSGRSEFFGSLRNRNRHPRHRLVLRRDRHNQPPRSPSVGQGIRPDRPAQSLARLLCFSSRGADDAGFRFNPHRIDGSGHPLHGGFSDSERHDVGDRDGTG